LQNDNDRKLAVTFSG